MINISDEKNIKINIASEKEIKTTISKEMDVTANVKDLDYIPGYKLAEQERRENEIKRISNENERIEYVNNLKQMVKKGELNGHTFIPSVDEDGVLSWENDGSLDNPDPIKIKSEIYSLTNTDIERLLNNQI